MKAVAAMSANRVIGREGRIPWHLPEDFRWFKQLTLDGVVVMGSKTFLSLGRPLARRTHVVLTRNPAALVAQCSSLWEDGGGQWRPRTEECAPIDSLAPNEVWMCSELGILRRSVSSPCAREVYLIGGAELYGQMLDDCSDLYLSLVDREVEGDAFFPAFEQEFHLAGVVLKQPEFEVRHYRRNPTT